MIRYLVSGSWSSADRIAAQVYNTRVNHLHDLQQELEDIVHENQRPPLSGMFSTETKTYHPTADLRDRIIAETEWCLREYDRLKAADNGGRTFPLPPEGIVS